MDPLARSSPPPANVFVSCKDHERLFRHEEVRSRFPGTWMGSNNLNMPSSTEPQKHHDFVTVFTLGLSALRWGEICMQWSFSQFRASWIKATSALTVTITLTGPGSTKLTVTVMGLASRTLMLTGFSFKDVDGHEELQVNSRAEELGAKTEELEATMEEYLEAKMEGQNAGSGRENER